MASVRVLIVDDEATLRTVLAAVFTDAGYSVSACASAEEALDALSAQPVEVLLVDKNLPAMNGIDLTRAVRDRGLATHVVMITGYPSTTSAIEAINVGVDLYLVKPFERVVTATEEVARLLQTPRRTATIRPTALLSHLLRERPLRPPPPGVLVSADPELRSRATRALGPTAQEYASVELGVVAVMDSAPQVIGSDDIEHLRRLTRHAPRACAWFFGVPPSFEEAALLLEIGAVCVSEPPPAPSDGVGT